MSIRFSDLQIILPRSTQTSQIQPSSGEAAMMQQQIASRVSSAVERKQQMVTAGEAIDGDFQISEQKQRKQGNDGRNSHKDSSGRKSIQKTDEESERKLLQSWDLGENIDIKV